MSHAGNEELKEKIYEDLYEELGREPTQEEVENDIRYLHFIKIFRSGNISKIIFHIGGSTTSA
tara:strand:+ start:247 stop:435 length:189 start_codon:yes stop_codon:yes gene_type:complete